MTEKIKLNNSNSQENEMMMNANLDGTDTGQETQDLTSDYRTLFILMYSLIFLISLIANSLLLVILCRRKRMRTVNNFFLANITASNLIYTLFAPFPFIIELENVNKAWIFLDSIQIKINQKRMLSYNHSNLVYLNFVQFTMEYSN